MLIENQSKLSDEQILPLVEWVAGRFSPKLINQTALGLCNIRVFHPKGKLCGFDAWAHYWITKQFKLPKQIRYLVRIEVGLLRYPLEYQYTKKSPKLIYQTWQEDFIATLVHELHHLECEKSGGKNGDLGAELRAKEALIDFRSRAPVFSQQMHGV